MTLRTLIAFQIPFLIVSVLGLGNAVAANPCDDHSLLIDQRSSDHAKADQEKERLRCVEFVFYPSTANAGHGWVEWHHVRPDRPTQTHRLGLFPAQNERAMVFGRVPEELAANQSALTLTVLLPSHRWWLVNTTRHGWQLRSGTVSEPDMDTLRKLFTDVVINAGLAEQAQSFKHWWPGGDSG